MSLRELLERERRGIARLVGASGTVLIAGGVAVLLALGTLLLGGARWLALPRPVPMLLWLGAIAGLMTGVRWVQRRLSRLATLPGVAHQVERERALRDGSLRGTLEVSSSGSLGRLGAEQLAGRLASVREPVLAPALRRRMWRGVGLGAAAAAGGLAMLVAGTAVAPDGWAALLHPVKAWRGTLLEGVRLEGVPSSVLRGERLTVAIVAPGRRTVILHHRRTGDAWRATPVAVRDGRATVQLDPIDADLALVAGDGRATSDTAAVRMVERPFIGGVTVRAVFPAYLDRQEETIPLGEPARIPQGTQLSIEGESSTELQSVRLASGSRAVPLEASGRHFSGRLVASASGRYEWSAMGRTGPIGDVPPALELELLPDSAPQVEILAPAVDTTVSAGDTVAISVLATDDHGLASVGIRSWIVTAAGERRPVTMQARPGGGEPQWSGELALSSAGLRAGDALHVVATATDRSPWRLTGESREVVLRLPTLAEQRDAVRAAADSAVARASSAAAAQKQLQQRTSDASKRRDAQGQAASGQQSNMSYEASEQAKSFAKEQRQLADRVEQLQEAAKQLENQLRQAGALDSALQERLREAQKLLREALTPELAEQLRKLEQASQQLSQEDARKALADLAEQQRRMREQLEKSVEMLKRAALEGSMNTLTDEARELAQQERALADSIARARDQRARSEAQREAKELAERTRDLTAEVQELQQRLKQEKAEGGAERMAEAERRMQQAAQAMERAAQRDEDRPKTGTPPQGQPPGQRQDQQGQPRGQPQQQQGPPQAGQPQGQPQQGQQGQPQPGQQGQQQAGQRGQQGQPQPGQQPGEPPSGEDAARQAARAMEEAAEQLEKAREQQIGEWKQELTSELDRSIQEMIQLAREQDRLEQEARRGTPPSALRPQQSTLQQGVEKSAERLAQAAQRSSHVSQRSLRSMSDARKRVEEATRQTQTAQTSVQAANAMREASEALNVAAASLVRDRERTESAQSASGFAEMLQQLQQMAQQQSALNSSVQDLLPRPGNSLDSRGQQESRQLARQQREVAAQLDDVADRDDSGRADELAKEARQIAQILESAQLDPAVLERQQRLFRKMLDAGRLLEEDEREDTGKREAKAWTGSEVYTPQGTTGTGRAATRFQPPTWNDLRGLSPEERRLVLEYFKKINGDKP